MRSKTFAPGVALTLVALATCAWWPMLEARPPVHIDDYVIYAVSHHEVAQWWWREFGIWRIASHPVIPMFFEQGSRAAALFAAAAWRVASH